MHANATLTHSGAPRWSPNLFPAALRCARSRPAFGVCEKTVRRWRERAAQLGSPARLPDGSSAPRRQPTRTSALVQERIVALRRAHRTYAQIRVVLPDVSMMATLSRELRRHGLQRLSALDPPRPPPVRYEYSAPGGLLHLDINKLGRFTQPGMRATGQRTTQPRCWRGELPRRHRRPQPRRLRLSLARRKAAQRLERAAPDDHVLRRPRRLYRACPHRPGCLLPLQALRASLPRAGPQASLHPALPSPDPRQSRTLHPDHDSRMGLRLHCASFLPSSSTITTSIALTPLSTTFLLPSDYPNLRTTS